MSEPKGESYVPELGDEDEEFWEEEEEPKEVLEGTATPASGSQEEIGDFVLELSAQVFKLGILLSEMDEDEFKAIRRRLAAFSAAVKRLPTSSQTKRRVGFNLVASEE